jgi:alpha-L-rhamnosidase
MLKNSLWISYPTKEDYTCPVFKKKFTASKEIKKATLKITSLGCYYAELNGARIGDFILAPGWTYYKRTQMQTYDITHMINNENEIRATLSSGWFNGRINQRTRKELPDVYPALICEIEIIYCDNTKEYVYSDESWECALSKITFSDIYDGESYDATYEEKFIPVKVQNYSEFKIVKQQADTVKEQEIIYPQSIYKTP